MRTISAVALASILAIGCDEPRPEPDGGPQVDACATCMADAGSDSGPTGDGNDTFATATDIEVGAAVPTEGVIDPAGDLDYYTFEGTEGQWIEIVTDTDDTADPRTDPVITLYDSSMTQIAENDDSLPRFDVDAGLITRLPAAGTYYILIQEWSTWAEDTPVGGAAYEYVLAISELDDANVAVNVDTETGDDVASALALTERTEGANGISFIVGTFDDETDVDVYSFTMPGTAAGSFSVNLMPEGADGYGAAAAPTRLRITNADGTETIASMNPSAFSPLEAGTNVDLAPSLPPGDYLLFVESAASADFYVIKAFRGGDNPPEANEVTNNAIATPDPIAFAPNPDVADLRSGFVLAHLGDGDVDHFAITVMGTEQVTISCGSLSLGSGVQGLEVVLLDALPGTMTRAMDTETATEGALIENATVPAGDYVVRLTKTGQDAEVTGDWVRCGFHLQPPAP